MNSIKGLIRKDIYIGKRSFIIFGAVFVLVIILMFLFRFAFIYGNLADATMFEDENNREFSMRYFDIIFPVAVSLITLVGFGITFAQALESDFNCKWFSYAFSCGVTEKKIAAAKHIENLSSVIIPCAANAAVGAIYLGFFNNDSSALGVFAGIVILPLIFGIISCIENTLMLKFRKLQTVQIIMMAILLAAAAGAFTKFIPFIEKMSENSTAMLDSFMTWVNTNKGALAVLLIAAYIIIWTASFFINTAILKRREKICGA
ncbi:MAG: hypothetical protein ACI4J6_12600 [Oscillospiraceae bacterium]